MARASDCKRIRHIYRLVSSGPTVADRTDTERYMLWARAHARAESVHRMSRAAPTGPDRSPTRTHQSGSTKTILYRFGDATDGVDPTGSLVVNCGGDLFGTTTATYEERRRWVELGTSRRSTAAQTGTNWARSTRRAPNQSWLIPRGQRSLHTTGEPDGCILGPNCNPGRRRRCAGVRYGCGTIFALLPAAS